MKPQVKKEISANEESIKYMLHQKCYLHSKTLLCSVKKSFCQHKITPLRYPFFPIVKQDQTIKLKPALHLQQLMKFHFNEEKSSANNTLTKVNKNQPLVIYSSARKQPQTPPKQDAQAGILFNPVGVGQIIELVYFYSTICDTTNECKRANNFSTHLYAYSTIFLSRFQFHEPHPRRAWLFSDSHPFQA